MSKTNSGYVDLNIVFVLLYLQSVKLELLVQLKLQVCFISTLCVPYM